MAGSQNYSLAEIKAIIKACRESGVTQLQIGTFKAQFSPPEPKTPVAALPTHEQVELAKDYENEAFREAERRLKLEDLAQLRLTDPVMYEELQARGELEHVREESEGSDT
jgi:hypothetical protein